MIGRRALIFLLGGAAAALSALYPLAAGAAGTPGDRIS
jgi:hypothetical protein